MNWWSSGNKEPEEEISGPNKENLDGGRSMEGGEQIEDAPWVGLESPKHSFFSLVKDLSSGKRAFPHSITAHYIKEGAEREGGR